MFGFLNLHKPTGVTSRDVVNQVQRLLPRRTKVGHAGTLDPLATGVLVVAVGPATRLMPFVGEFPKSYRAEFLLGRRSDTDDVTGTVEIVHDAPAVSREAVENALRAFRGTILQTPPQYSAVKVSGRRAYAAARAGERVDLKPRAVAIHRIEIVAFEDPRLALDIECSSGTYVRSLARDLGDRLGTGAVMSGLVRTAVGPFRIADAIDPRELTRDSVAAHVQDPLLAVPGHRRVVLAARAIEDVRRGRTVKGLALEGATCPAAAIDDSSRLVALGEWRAPTGSFHPSLVFVE